MYANSGEKKKFTVYDALYGWEEKPKIINFDGSFLFSVYKDKDDNFKASDTFYNDTLNNVVFDYIVRGSDEDEFFEGENNEELTDEILDAVIDFFNDDDNPPEFYLIEVSDELKEKLIYFFNFMIYHDAILDADVLIMPNFDYVVWESVEWYCIDTFYDALPDYFKNNFNIPRHKSNNKLLDNGFSEILCNIDMFKKYCPEKYKRINDVIDELFKK